MIIFYTREHCGYCPDVRKYLNLVNVEFEERDGDPLDQEYLMFARKFGSSVPLVINTETDRAVMGNAYGKIKELVGADEYK